MSEPEISKPLGAWRFFLTCSFDEETLSIWLYTTKQDFHS
jgi:hypothetical protein